MFLQSNEYMGKIVGFTYVRNGFEYGYPFIASIQSLLPLVEELIVVVGDSTDKTKQAIQDLKNPKIKIIDVIWDMSLRQGGVLFAQQSNIGIVKKSRNFKKGRWASLSFFTFLGRLPAH